MRARPILFSGPMVRAILDGRKTQTRRVMKPQPRVMVNDHGDGVFVPIERLRESATKPGEWIDADGTNFSARCPYGKPGDRLWVRETFAGTEGYTSIDWIGVEWDEDPKPPRQKPRGPYRLRYRASERYDLDGAPPGSLLGSYDDPETGWRPSIHMPRWASRIALEVTEVRAERVQDIRQEDAYAEGVRLEHHEEPEHHGDWARILFRDLWDSINAKRGYGWDANPWVWVVGFRVEE